MKRVYTQPTATKVVFHYDDKTVVASGVTKPHSPYTPDLPYCNYEQDGCTLTYQERICTHWAINLGCF